MKHSLFFITAVFLLSLFQNTLVLAAPSDEEIVVDFQNRGRQILAGLKIADPEFFPQIKISLLDEAIRNTRVEVVKDKGFLNSRTASNFPDQHLIQIRRKHWIKAMELNSLVLHEYLGISGQERSETYSVSVEAINVLRKRLFDLHISELEGSRLFLNCSENYREKSHSIKNKVQYIKLALEMSVGFVGGSLGAIYLPANLNAISAVVGLGSAAYLTSKGNENIAGKTTGSYLGKNWAGRIYKLLIPVTGSSHELTAFSRHEIEAYHGMTGDELTTHPELERRIAALLNYGDGSGLFCPVGGALWNLNQIKQYVLQELSPLDAKK